MVVKARRAIAPNRLGDAISWTARCCGVGVAERLNFERILKHGVSSDWPSMSFRDVTGF